MANENYGNSRMEFSNNGGRIDSHGDLKNMGLSSDYDGKFYDHAKVDFNRDHGRLEVRLINTHAMDSTSLNKGKTEDNLTLVLNKREDVRIMGNYILPGLGDILVKAYSTDSEQ